MYSWKEIKEMIIFTAADPSTPDDILTLVKAALTEPQAEQLKQQLERSK